MNKKNWRRIMEKILMKSERCHSTSTLRREAEAEPSKKDVAEPDQIASGAAGTGQENEELEWARRHVAPDPYLPVRKTEIIGWGVEPRHKPGYRQWIKKMMKQEMMERDEP
jgi:hypothetical protein